MKNRIDSLLKSLAVRVNKSKINQSHLSKLSKNMNVLKNGKIENDLQSLANLNQTLIKEKNEENSLKEIDCRPEEVCEETNPQVKFSKQEINFFKDKIKKKEFKELDVDKRVSCNGNDYDVELSFIDEKYIKENPLSDDDILEIMQDSFIQNYSLNFDKENKIKLEQNKKRFNLEQKLTYGNFDQIKRNICNFLKKPANCNFEETKKINRDLKQIMYSIMIEMKTNKAIKNGDEKWALFFYNKIKSLSEGNFRNELFENIKVLCLLNEISNCFKTEEINRRDRQGTNTVAKNARFYLFNEQAANKVFENSKSQFTSFTMNYKEEIRKYLMDGMQKLELESGVVYKIDKLKEPEKRNKAILCQDDEKSIAQLRFFAAESWCTTGRDSAINYLKDNDSFIFIPKEGKRKFRIQGDMKDGKLEINFITTLENSTYMEYKDLEHFYEFVKFNRNQGLDVDIKKLDLRDNVKLNPRIKDILNDIAPSEIFNEYKNGILRAAFQDEVKVDSKYQNEPIKEVRLDTINNVEAQDDLVELEKLNLSLCNHINFKNLKKAKDITIKNSSEMKEQTINLDSLEDVDCIKFEHVNNVSMKNLKKAKNITIKLTLKELENFNFDIQNISSINEINFEIIDEDFKDSELYKYLFPKYEYFNMEERNKAIADSLNYFKENKDKYKSLISIIKNWNNIWNVCINKKRLNDQNREDITNF